MEKGHEAAIEAHSSSGLGHRPLKAEITGSNPVCATEVTFYHVSIRLTPGSRRSHFWPIPACIAIVQQRGFFYWTSCSTLQTLSTALLRGSKFHSFPYRRYEMPRRTNQLQQLIHSIHLQLYHDQGVRPPGVFEHLE